MPEYKIISRGKYKKSDKAMPVTVDSYVIAENEEGRFLMLRFCNEKNASLSNLTINLYQYNRNGKFIKKTCLNETLSETNGKFVLNKKIDVEKNCVKFSVELSVAQFGKYRYTVNDGELELDYLKESGKAYDASAQRKALKGKKSVAMVRRLTSPIAIGFLAVLLVACAAVFTYFHLGYFTENAEGFREGGVEYSFVTDSNGEYTGIVVTGYSGFYGNVVIPEQIGGYTVLSINGKAFEDSTIKSLTIEGDPEINSYAFYNCKSLSSVSLPMVTQIGSYAFSGCTSLKSVEIGGDVNITVTLSTRIFANCTSLRSVSINSPAIYSSASSIFYRCSSLSSLSLFNLNTGSNDAVNIGDLCGDGAKTSLQEINIYSLGYIGSSTFSGLNITSLTVDVLQSGEIPASAFSGCTYLQTLSLPVSVTYIGDSAFNKCGIQNIDLSQTEYIGKSAFYGSGLQSADMSSNTKITNINDYAFYNCTSLASVELPSACKTIGEYAFSRCSSLNTITLNDETVSIGNYAFDGCTSLETVSFGSQLSEIGMYAFASCLLSAVYLPVNLTIIKEGAFSGCTYLSTLSLPDNLAYIYEYAFSNCSALFYVKVPSSVTYLGYGVFSGCNSINELYFCTIANALNNYFAGSVPSSLKTVTVESGTIPSQAFTGCEYVQNINLPQDLTEIGNYTFSNCSALKNITIPDTVQSIGSHAFFCCESLDELVLPNSLKYIYDSAFYGCGALSYVELPSKLSFIYDSAFCGCYNLREVCNYSSLSISAGNEDYGMVAAYAVVVYTASSQRNSTVTTTYNNINLMRANGTWYAISANTTSSLSFLILKYNNTTISGVIVAPYAFYMNETITSAELGVVTEIGDYAFYGCSKLSSVKFGTSLTTIKQYAFSSCTSLTSLDLPACITAINKYAFADCTALSTVILRGSPNIASYAFYDCTVLYEVYDLAGMGVTVSSDSNGMVGKYALCVYTDINAERRVAVTGDYVFFKTDGVWSLLKYTSSASGTLTLPESFTSPAGAAVTSYTITANAFNNLSLQYIVIPTAVTRIYQNAFKNVSYNYICYGGTQSGWQNINSAGLSNVLYYATCVHETGYWTYNSGGSIVRTVSTHEETAVEATCATEGRINIVCDVCGKVLSYYNTAKTDHTFGTDGVCSVCGKKGEAVTGTNYTDLTNVTVTNDDENPYVYENDAWRSENSTRNSSSTFTITAKKAVMVYVSLTCSANTGDRLYIVITRTDGTQTTYATINGGGSCSYSIALEEGESLSIKFYHGYTNGTIYAYINLLVTYPSDDE